MDATEVIRKGFDYWNKKDKGSFLADFTASSEIIAPGGLILRGLEGAEMFWDGWQSAFPDNQLTLRAIFGTGDQVAVEATFEGTHTGTLNAPDGSQVPPTGKHLAVPYVEIYTVHDGKIVANHVYFDQVELLTQLGLIAASGT